MFLEKYFKIYTTFHMHMYIFMATLIFTVSYTFIFALFIRK